MKEILIEKAQKNDYIAMFELGIYELLVNKNYEQSYIWLIKSYENGYDEAVFGLTFLYYQTNNEAMYYWANKVFEKFGDYYSEEYETYRLSTCIHVNIKQKERKFEIGIEYKLNDTYLNFIYPLEELFEKKFNYNEELEKEINNIQLYEELDKVAFMLEDLYKKTNYPGCIYQLGEIYYFGYWGLQKIDKEKGMEYFKKAANEGYMKAISTLREIYLGKATHYINKAYSLYGNDSYDQMMKGNCIIADYLIGTMSTHYNYYEQYYKGLNKLIEASQNGCNEATLILELLGKDKLTKKMYQKALDKEKNQFSDYLFSYYEDSLIEKEDFDEEEFEEII